MTQAPEFSLPDQHGTIHRLSDYRGRWLVLYTYPKDDTPGCTTEACNFRDHAADLAAHTIAVLGISKDTVGSHQRFAAKFTLNFPILSDPEKTTLRAYNSLGPKKFMGRVFEGVLRKTFLIDPQGTIRKIYEGMDLQTHAQTILADVRSLKADETGTAMV